MKIKACIKSMRLRTLPLSESGVLLGLFVSCREWYVSFWTGFFLVLTTALLQILSNLSNELGDTLQGTDTDDRTGIRYSLQDGDMTVEQMKKLIVVVAALCCISGAVMVYVSFGTLLGVEPIVLLSLGAAAIVAAMRYTLGKRPYGYRGLGDLFVFIFFGLVSVLGGYYVCTHDLSNFVLFLPACAIGLFSVAVLNVNNIRDMKSDMATRTTVAILLGESRARVYQTALVAIGWVLLSIYTALTFERVSEWIYVLTLPLFVLHLKGVWTRNGRELDSMLPLLVMSTFATTLLIGLGFLIS